MNFDTDLSQIHSKLTNPIIIKCDRFKKKGILIDHKFN